MATGYIKEFDSQPNDKIDAELFNNEYGLLQSSFDQNSGHNHAGEVGVGGFIPLISDINYYNTITINQLTDEIELTNRVNDTRITSLTLSSTSLVPGIDNTITLGSHSKKFLNLYLSGSGTLGTLRVGTTDPNQPENPGELVGITEIYDDDSFVADSDTALATQQSIKSYVDTKVGNSIGLFVQSEFVKSESIVSLTGSFVSYIQITMNNLLPNSKIKINGTITAEVLANSTGDTGRIECQVYRDNLAVSHTFYIAESFTTDTNFSTIDSTSIIFQDEPTITPGQPIVYSLRIRSQTASVAKVLNGTLTVLEETTGN